MDEKTVMTPIKQTIMHDPDNGQYGNCAQAAIASLFDLSLEDVPHFAEGLSDNEMDAIEFNLRLQNWLKERGFGLLIICTGRDYLIEWQQICKEVCDYHLISGRTERGTMHVVVGKDGKIVHDPHPSNAGLLEPIDKNPWYFEFIIKRL